LQTLREIERIVCFSEAPQQMIGQAKLQEEEAAKLRREFDAAILAGSLGERDQMLAAIQQPKLIAERTEVRILQMLGLLKKIIKNTKKYNP
jgi:hypothetical protein